MRSDTKVSDCQFCGSGLCLTAVDSIGGFSSASAGTDRQKTVAIAAITDMTF